MKLEEFTQCPKWDDCFIPIYPTEFKVGSIFSNEGPKLPEDQKWQEIRRVEKIETLKDHKGYIVITSTLVGFTRSSWVSEDKIVRSYWLFGDVEQCNYKFAVIEYYDEDILNRKGCLYCEGKNRQKVEVFFCLDLKNKYYTPDIEKFKHLKVPVEYSGFAYVEYHSLDY